MSFDVELLELGLLIGDFFEAFGDFFKFVEPLASYGFFGEFFLELFVVDRFLVKKFVGFLAGVLFLFEALFDLEEFGFDVFEVVEDVVVFAVGCCFLPS